MDWQSDSHPCSNPHITNNTCRLPIVLKARFCLTFSPQYISNSCLLSPQKLWQPSSLSKPTLGLYCCFFLIIFKIHFLLAVLGLHRCTGFSLAEASRGYSPVAVRGLLFAAACCKARARGHVGSVISAPGRQGARAGARESRPAGSRARARGSWPPGARVQGQRLWSTGLVALRPVGSPQTRDRTCFSCLGRRILYH